MVDEFLGDELSRMGREFGPLDAAVFDVGVSDFGAENSQEFRTRANLL